MRVSVEHLSSRFNSDLLNENGVFEAEILTEILDKLTLAGIELEKIIPATDPQYADVLEFKITPNRGDCLSLNGLVREIELLTNYTSNPNNDILFNNDIAIKANVVTQIELPQECFNYYNLSITNIDNTKTLPQIMLRRLISAGFNSVSPLVDILNYVMLEIGQPLFSYKLDSIRDGAKIRLASSHEQLLLLNKTTVTLDSNTLIITNMKDEIVSIAGVIGALSSVVEGDTKNICLESCCFEPKIIMGKAKQYGVNSDAAYRFERGVANALAKPAILYASYLITKYLGGEVESLQLTNPYVAPEVQINTSYSYIQKVIGQPIASNQIKQILSKLQCKLITSNADTLEVLVPAHRFDIKIAQDLVEEIIRVYGYNNITPVFPCSRISFIEDDPLHNKLNAIKAKLVTLGYNEVINYAFVESDLLAQFGVPNTKAIKLQNPIANWSTMRNSLIGGLISNLSSNIKRGADLAQLFEVANVFYGEDYNLQRLKVAGLIYNLRQSNNWFKQNPVVDFYDIKHDVEILLGAFAVDFIALDNYPVFHPSRCAKIVVNDLEVGVIGQLHPSIVVAMDLATAPYVFELDLAEIANQEQSYVYKQISKYPKVERDLSFVLNSDTKASELVSLLQLKRSSIDYLIKIDIFDIYFDKVNNENRVAIKLIFQSDKTLQENDIKTSLNTVIELIFKHFNAKLKA